MSFHLFERFGVELEYMVVDRETLAVRPIVDQVLKQAAARPRSVVEEDGNPDWPGEVTLGAISWSNELTLHVIELKTAEPIKELRGVHHVFGEHVQEINRVLEPMGAMLMPTGMHPTMNPDAEMKLWPHDNSPVYDAFNRIFDCRGHGWANLQSCHLNLPFGDADVEKDDGEFARLHAAIRALLPIMPALSASTPIMDGKATGLMDNRLEVYRTNSAKIPQAAGKVIPEPVYTKSAYDATIFQSIYKAYEPYDPEGTLRYEWANSRGAIARFMRNTIEVRVLDVQESPRADLAIASAITCVLKSLAAEKLGNPGAIRALGVEPMHAILLSVIRDAERARITDGAYLRALGFEGASCTAAELWRDLIARSASEDRDSGTWMPVIDHILSVGCLSRRIMQAIGKTPTPKMIAAVYRRLAGCLSSNAVFVP